ncbi:MAG: RDD family protein [Bacteroidota bacterium]
MLPLIVSRVLAVAIDYALALCYAVVLAGLSLSLFSMTGTAPVPSHPVHGQLLGLFLLTLPVFLYHFLLEQSRGTTLGKRWCGIRVVAEGPSVAPRWLLRNVLKFLPWEIAHAGIHWLFHYIRLDTDPPVWVWVLLTLPQLMVLGYAVSALLSRGQRSVYDRLAGARVTRS